MHGRIGEDDFAAGLAHHPGQHLIEGPALEVERRRRFDGPAPNVRMRRDLAPRDASRGGPFELGPGRGEIPLAPGRERDDAFADSRTQGAARHRDLELRPHLGDDAELGVDLQRTRPLGRPLAAMIDVELAPLQLEAPRRRQHHAALGRDADRGLVVEREGDHRARPGFDPRSGSKTRSRRERSSGRWIVAGDRDRVAANERNRGHRRRRGRHGAG